MAGPARRFLHARSEEDLIWKIREADGRGEPVLVMGEGSNLLVSDQGFDGLVLSVETEGIEHDPDPAEYYVTAKAGECWDGFVASCVGRGLAGLECLSGIPGRVGGALEAKHPRLEHAATAFRIADADGLTRQRPGDEARKDKRRCQDFED